MADNEDPELLKYAVMFAVSIDGMQTFTEKVFARDQLTAVARAASNITLKGYSIFEVLRVVPG